MHDLGENSRYFYPFYPSLLAQGYKLCGTFCIKIPEHLKHDEIRTAICHNLTRYRYKIADVHNIPYDCENSSCVALKTSEWPLLVRTGAKNK